MALALYFELGISLLIAASAGVGIIQIVDGYENTLVELEWFAIGMFTLEDLLRFIGAPADPEKRSLLASIAICREFLIHFGPFGRRK